MLSAPEFSSAIYTFWQRKGIAWLSAPETIHLFLSQHFPEFDLFGLLAELEQVAASTHFEWTRIQIRIMDSGNLRIEHQFDNLIDEVPLSLIQTLLVDLPRRAAHEEMVLPNHLQRQGLSRKLLLPYYRQYRTAGVERILVQAGLSGGGYAWARYGFAATSQVDVRKILATGENRGVARWQVEELLLDVDAFYAKSAAPFPLESWARLPFGERLLAGTTWWGELDLRNPEQVQVFEAYLYAR